MPEAGPGAARLTAPPREGLPPDVGDTIAAAAAAFSITEKVHSQGARGGTDRTASSVHPGPRRQGCTPAGLPDSGRNVFVLEPRRRRRAKGRKRPRGRASSAAGARTSTWTRTWARRWRPSAPPRPSRTSGRCSSARCTGNCLLAAYCCAHTAESAWKAFCHPGRSWQQSCFGKAASDKFDHDTICPAGMASTTSPLTPCRVSSSRSSTRA